MFTIISIFQEFIKEGAGIKVGELEKIFENKKAEGGDDYTVLESYTVLQINHKPFIPV